MKTSQINIIAKLQRWMDSENGQTFMNYAYSWGASVVILGTLFKLTHLPGANFFLFLGMGTEVLVFFIAAFDRPFDKAAGTVKGVASEQDAGGVTRVVGEQSVPAPGNGLREVMNAHLAEIEKINALLTDGQEAEKIRETMTAIHQVYQQQLLKVSSQLTFIDKMDSQIRVQNTYMGELNKAYARMIKAVGGKVLPEHEKIDGCISSRRE